MKPLFPPDDPKSEPREHLTIGELGTRALRRFRAQLTPDQMCGAKKRSTGEPCRNIPAKGRTRCRLHGGATPRGNGPAGWHTPGFPAGLPTEKPRSAALKALKRRRQRARVAAMTPEERARHDEWHRIYKPGSDIERAYGRRNREAGRLLDRLLHAPPPPSTPAKIELAALRAKAVAHLARLDAEIAASADGEPPAGDFFD